MAALATASQAVELAGLTRFAEQAKPIAHRALGRAVLADGDPVRAEEHAHTALTAAANNGDDWILSEALDLLATVAVATGAFVDAARMLGASDRVRDEIVLVRGVIDEAIVDDLVVQITESLGVEAYEAARAEGRAMDRDDAIAFVRRGRGKRGRPTFGWSSLTPAELDVVRYVAEGCRNRTIAEKLFISEATVKTHLTHVFAKLAVTSRAELAAQVARRHAGETAGSGPGS